MLTPWTGPAWIKDNPSLHYGTLKNEYIDTWALYLAKSVEGFEAALKGIDSNPSRQFVHSVTLQNEPLHDPCDYACMRMST
jgi:O-glycosyl hydrolase